jgi:HSP20 family protein
MTMLMRTDPFQTLEQWSQQLLGQQGLWGRPTVGAMDAYRHGEQFVVQFDLPGVDLPRSMSGWNAMC